MKLTQLVYVSRATAHADQIELADLARQSSIRNAHEGITGALLFCDGYFVQALEGDADAIRRLYETIQNDRRHCDCQVLSQRTIRYREFGRWGMSLLDLNANEADRRSVEQLANAVYSVLHGTTNLPSDARSLLQEIDAALLEVQMPIATGF